MSAIKVTLRDEKEDVDKICIEVQKTSDNAGGKPARGFTLQHKNFCFELRPRLTSKESLIKELRARSGLHSRKVELSRVKYFHAFVSTLNYVSPIAANSD